MHVQYRRVGEAQDPPLILHADLAAGSVRRTPSFWGKGCGLLARFLLQPACTEGVKTVPARRRRAPSGEKGSDCSSGFVSRLCLPKRIHVETYLV